MENVSNYPLKAVELAFPQNFNKNFETKFSNKNFVAPVAQRNAKQLPSTKGFDFSKNFSKNIKKSKNAFSTIAQNLQKQNKIKNVIINKVSGDMMDKMSGDLQDLELTSPPQEET